MGSIDIPKTQMVALVNSLGGKVEFKTDYPVPDPGPNEVLAKVLYSGVCQSDLHTKAGTAAGPDGNPITKIKLPHVGGHEGIGQIVALGPNITHSTGLKLGVLVGIRFSSRICRRCEFCLAGTEQYCVQSTNHLHHEDGSFQQYIALDADYLTILPDDIDPMLMGPVLCAGLTAYKAILNANIRPGNWLVVVGAGGGLGHLAVQYARAQGALVIGVDTGTDKRGFVLGLGAEEFIDFATEDPVKRVHEITGLGAHAAVVTAGSSKAFAHACEMLRVGGSLSCVGIPPGRPCLETPICMIVIKGLRITGNLVGSLKECMEAVDLVRRGVVKPVIKVRPFKDLPDVYENMEKGDIAGRVVLKISD
ncbi:Polyketide synthase enoylreductase [Penicillium macrosclerotiorum]|uniref:Polyketide synthase enoylreductase n=1 Tax=Penicillium macrosclerotiorum TaxID=303699 RepID=UPI00254718BF|nr:Polyketide synthase enoylreductase [Penicillium macrosclerotiorum]KAJ5669534.1 Polyketide synthase enoylreductase [Penicillium macrosclerotiorum]